MTTPTFRLSVLLIFLMFNFSVSQKLQYSTLLIPDSLKIDANACIRESTTEITLKEVNHITNKKTRVVTVFNKLGNIHANLYSYYDNDTKIINLSVKIYDSLGNEIKKYSKNKFTDISAVDGGTLYSDTRLKYVDYTPISYPYTVVFESEIKSSSTGFIPTWMPIENYYLSTQKSSFSVKNPNNFNLRTKENNFDNFTIKKSLNNNEITYSSKNLKAIKSENNSPSYFNILPLLYVVTDSFTLKKVYGNASNWQEFGKWYYEKLLKGRNELPKSTQNKIKHLTKQAKTNVEKAKIVYDFVQKNTRYISVQVGIGGWQPISAEEVDKLGYGDCKGLANYTKALLDVVGVQSNYTVVWAKSRRDIVNDFASIQGNHIILNIPDGEKDIWLECTSQTLPFGFLGRFTEDRKVLVITREGGSIKHTPAYENKSNYQSVDAKIMLEIDGSLSADILRVSKGIQYDDRYHIQSKSKKELIEYFKSNVWSYNNNLEIKEVLLQNDKNNVVFSEKMKVFIKNYASINNNEFLLRLNVFNKFSAIPKRYRNRKLPFEIKHGFLDKDEFTFQIPEGYVISNLPEAKEIFSEFGVYKISIEKKNDTQFVYKKYFSLKKGVYAKKLYKSYRNFIKKVVRYENSKIIITKQ